MRECNIDISLLEKVVLNEANIKALTNKKSDDYNISKLLGIKLTQSQSIRFGKKFEKIVGDLILLAKDTELEEKTIFDIYELNDKNSIKTKGKKNVDMIFKKNNKRYYFELKTNMNLDSEKSKITDEKIKQVTNYFEKKYNEKIISGCLTCWYGPEKKIVNKLKTDIYYMKDLFEILDFKITKEEYYTTFKKLGQKIIKMENTQ